MADRQPPGASPVTPPGASPTTNAELHGRVELLERQVRNLQISILAMLGGDNDNVRRISHLRDLSDTLGECFDLHAEQIEAIKKRVSEIESIIRGQPVRMKTNHQSEQQSR